MSDRPLTIMQAIANAMVAIDNEDIVEAKRQLNAAMQVCAAMHSLLQTPTATPAIFVRKEQQI